MAQGECPKNGSTLGAFIRAQRQMANLSLRQLSAMTKVSNPYLSQIERGMSEPSIRVLVAIAKALGIGVDAMYAQMGLTMREDNAKNLSTEAAIQSDSRLTEAQRSTLLSMLRTLLEVNESK